MGKIIIIAAVGKNLELGKNNNLIWRFKEDLQFFKNQTLNHKIVMGYNTFLSLGRLLPKREHIVLTHRDLEIDQVTVFHNFETLLSYLQNLNEDVYIIGGAAIYQLFINEADEMLLTEIHAEDKTADVYFPSFNPQGYERQLISSQKEQDISFDHVSYKRKKTI